MLKYSKITVWFFMFLYHNDLHISIVDINWAAIRATRWIHDKLATRASDLLTGKGTWILNILHFSMILKVFLMDCQIFLKYSSRKAVPASFKLGLKVLFGQGLVDVPPVHTGRRPFVVDEKTILGRPPCEGSCGNGQGPCGGEHAFTAQQSLKNQLGGRKVPMGSAHAFQSDGVQPRIEGGISNVFHVRRFDHCILVLKLHDMRTGRWSGLFTIHPRPQTML